MPVITGVEMSREAADYQVNGWGHDVPMFRCTSPERVLVLSPAGNSIPTAWSGTLLHGSLGRDTVVWTSSRRWLRLTVTVSCISELSRAHWFLGYNNRSADV